MARIIATVRRSEPKRSAVLSMAHDHVALQQAKGHEARVLVPPEQEAWLIEAGFESHGARAEILADRASATQIVNFINLLNLA